MLWICMISYCPLNQIQHEESPEISSKFEVKVLNFPIGSHNSKFIIIMKSIMHGIV